MDSVRPINSALSSKAAQQRAKLELEAQVTKLAARDREVRAHEAAHLAAGGGLARGGASFTCQLGPDGRMYAIGGEVRIDTSLGLDPTQTIARAQQIREAALAPSSPSGQDLEVASQAAQIEEQAQKAEAKKTKSRLQGATSSGGLDRLGDAASDAPKSLAGGGL